MFIQQGITSGREILRLGWPLQEILRIVRDSSSMLNNVNISTSFYGLATKSEDFRLVLASQQFALLLKLAGEVPRLGSPPPRNYICDMLGQISRNCPPKLLFEITIIDAVWPPLYDKVQRFGLRGWSWL